jgi:hypothetical protein
VASIAFWLIGQSCIILDNTTALSTFPQKNKRIRDLDVAFREVGTSPISYRPKEGQIAQETRARRGVVVFVVC